MMGIGSPHIRSGQHWLAYRRQSPKVAVKDPVTRIPQAVERVHWDPYMAAEIGMPNAYDYGSQRGGWATHFMTNWAGDDGWVAECYPFYRGMNFVGDLTRIKGEITGKWRGEERHRLCLSQVRQHQPARREHHAGHGRDRAAVQG